MDISKVGTTLAESLANAEAGADRLERLINRLDGELRGFGSTNDAANPVPCSIAGRASYLADRLHRLSAELETICSTVASEPVTQLSAGFHTNAQNNYAAASQQFAR
jgi:hypothetical protein